MPSQKYQETSTSRKIRRGKVANNFLNSVTGVISGDGFYLRNPDRKHQLILPCAGGYHTVVPDCRQGGRKNQVDWFLPDCGPEQWSISANVQHIVGGRSCTCAHQVPTPSLSKA